MDVESNFDPLFQAATVPTTTPNRVANRVAGIMSASVFKSLVLNIKSLTGARYWKDIPKLNVKEFFMYIKYCSHRGLSRPNSFKSAFLVSAVNFGFSMRKAVGSPGITLKRKKFNVTVMKKRMAPSIKRFITNSRNPILASKI